MQPEFRRPRTSLLSSTALMRFDIHGREVEQQAYEFAVDVIVPAPEPTLFEDTTLGELIQITRCRRPGHGQIPFHEGDLGIGLTEDIVDQVLTLEPVTRSYEMLVLLQKPADCLHQRRGVSRRDIDATQQIQQPAFPVAGLSHPL